MAKTKKPVPAPVHIAAASKPTSPAAKSDNRPVIALAIEGVNAKGLRCPAGTVISPDVDGWPAHRVEALLRDGRAVKVPADGD